MFSEGSQEGNKLKEERDNLKFLHQETLLGWPVLLAATARLLAIGTLVARHL
jgi:hypothetical protein